MQMTDIIIPPAALEAGARAIASDDGWPLGWEDYVDTARAAFLAMLDAWPGMRHYPDMEVFASKARIILPLPQETSDDPQNA